MRRLSLVAIVLASVLGGGSSARAAEMTVGLAKDAWYQSPAGLSGTPVDAPTTYPDGTLHVGVTGGTEQARSYVEIDLSALPRGAELTGGTLRLPVLGSEAGTSSFETARLRACLATEPFEEVAGSSATPPPIDCDTSAAAVPVGTADSPALEIGLGVFINGRANGVAALALVPAASALSPPTTWHVAFPGRSSESETPITAELAYREGAPRPAPSVTPSVVRPDPLPGPAATNDGGSVDFGAVRIDDVTGGVTAPGAELAELADTTAAAQPVSMVTYPFSHPEVFLLPFALLGLGVVLAWVFTTPTGSERV